MIRFLQTPGPTKKIVLGGLLLVICAAMVITLVPGGVGSNLGFGGPGAGVVAKVAGEDITSLEVQRQDEGEGQDARADEDIGHVLPLQRAHRQQRARPLLERCCRFLPRAQSRR